MHYFAFLLFTGAFRKQDALCATHNSVHKVDSKATEFYVIKRSILGVSTVEFVVVFPVTVVLVLFVIQLGFVYIAKLTLNHATLMAARHGAVSSANVAAMRGVLVKGLTPFYQNSMDNNATSRISEAFLRAHADQFANLRLTRISPNEHTFRDFGVEKNGQMYIPNDNLRWRNSSVGIYSGINIQEANILKIKVVYGYELKVPLMGTLVRTILCSASRMPLQGLGEDSGSRRVIAGGSLDCVFYRAGRVPIESFAVVEMHSPSFP